MPKTKSEIDSRVGMRLRERRILAKLSQGEVGTLLGVTFQQVQKYELGVNRISAGRLLEIAKALNVPIAYFFYDADPPPRDETAVLPLFPRTALSADALHFGSLFARIQGDPVKRAIRRLVETLASASED